MGVEVEEREEIDPDEVIQALGRVDEPTKDPKPADEPAKLSPARVAAARAEEKANAGLAVAWALAERDIKKTCPDLDDETRAMLKKSAGDNPVEYVEQAEKLQDKMAAKGAAKKPADEQAALKDQIVKEVFDGGGPGGDPNAVRVPEKSEAQKLEDAVKVGNTRGIIQSLGRTIEKEKLFERGVSIKEG